MSLPAVTPYNVHNTNQNFVPIGLGSDWNLQTVLVEPSVAIAGGTALCTQVTAGATTGYVAPMPTVASKGQNFKGILLFPITASDSDYASTTKTRDIAVPVTPFAKAQARVGNGTLTSFLVGSTVAFYSDSASIDVGTLGQGCVITDIIAATNTSVTPAIAGTCLVNFNIADTTTSA